jgi:hypothetical protein
MSRRKKYAHADAAVKIVPVKKENAHAHVRVDAKIVLVTVIVVRKSDIFLSCLAWQKRSKAGFLYRMRREKTEGDVANCMVT